MARLQKPAAVLAKPLHAKSLTFQQTLVASMENTLKYIQLTRHGPVPTLPSIDKAAEIPGFFLFKAASGIKDTLELKE
ncbi:MAG: hypothetical protein KGK17_10715 [Betaproteobacteria bacterium]|nr:hypothetical protein [Betaproteobacteria bacterium]